MDKDRPGSAAAGAWLQVYRELGVSCLACASLLLAAIYGSVYICTASMQFIEGNTLSAYPACPGTTNRSCVFLWLFHLVVYRVYRPASVLFLSFSFLIACPVDHALSCKRLFFSPAVPPRPLLAQTHLNYLWLSFSSPPFRSGTYAFFSPRHLHAWLWWRVSWRSGWSCGEWRPSLVRKFLDNRLDPWYDKGVYSYPSHSLYPRDQRMACELLGPFARMDYCHYNWCVSA